MDKQKYAEIVKKNSPKSPDLKNCVWAFLIGGFICAAGEDNYARKSSCRRLSQVFTVVINIIFLYIYYCFYLRHLAT